MNGASPVDDLINALNSILQSRGTNADFVAAFERISSNHRLNGTEMLELVEASGRSDLVDQIIGRVLSNRPGDREIYCFALQFYIQGNRYARGVRIATDCLRRFPNDAFPYNFLAYAFKYLGNPDRVRELLAEMYGQRIQPVFFQAAMKQDIPNAVATAAAAEVAAASAIEFPAIQPEFGSPQGSPQVSTGSAQEIGTDGATLVGELGNARVGGEYRFEFGFSETNLDMATPWKPVPPGLFAEIWENAVASVGNWLVYGAAHRFKASPSAIESEWPFGIDRNHLDGIGQVTLLYGWRPSAVQPDEGNRPDVPGPAIDLRGGKISFRVRHSGMEGSGGVYVVGLNSYLVGDPEGRASQWMMTGQPQLPAEFPDGKLRDIEFDIDENPENWTFAANNPNEQDDSSRYTYLPVSDLVETHNCAITMTEAFTDETKIAKGTLELQGGRIIYRDRSIIRDGYGAELVAAPGDDLAAARRLVNGKYRNINDGWQGNLAKGAPTFLWRLPDGAQPQTVVLAQHPVAPTRTAIVRLLREGAVIEEHRLNMPNPSANAPERTSVEMNAPAWPTHLEVTLDSGHVGASAGLLGVEAFGTFTPAIVAQEPVTLSADVDAIPSGSTMRYRLVYRDSLGTVAGEVCEHDAPSDRKPLLKSLSPIDDKGTHWLVRANAMGLSSTLSVSLDDVSFAEIPLGCSSIRRHAAIRIPEHLRDRGGRMSVQARNQEGESNILEAMLS